MSCGFRFSDSRRSQRGFNIPTRTWILAFGGIVLVGIIAGFSIFAVSKMSNNASDKSYDDGNKAGYAAGEKAGYEKGLAEGKAAGIVEGKTAGTASIDVEAIKKKSYQNGFAAGNTTPNACLRNIAKYLENVGTITTEDDLSSVCLGN